MLDTPLLISVLVFLVLVLFSSGMYFYVTHLREHRDLMKRVKEQEVSEIRARGAFSKS